MSKHIIQEIMEDAGYECRSYSGRGMFGGHCLAIKGTIQSIGAELIDAIVEYDNDNAFCIAKEFRSAHTDSLGKGSITYFPNIDFVEDEDKDDE